MMCHCHRRQRGSVLITAMWIAIALSAMVLVLCRQMSVESMASRQQLAEAQAAAAELGAEQFALSIVAQELYIPGYKDETLWEARMIGDCYAWFLALPSDDDFTITFGLTDEASKIDVNSANADMLLYLPGMTEDLATAIVDWIDEDEETTGLLGAESPTYQSEYGYLAKNAPLESIGELRLIYGMEDYVLHGADINRDGVIDEYEYAVADAGLTFQSSMRGIMPFVTVYGVRATNQSVAAEALAQEEAEAAGETYQPPIDVNASNVSDLRTMLTDYLTSGGGGNIVTRTQQQGRQRPFASIWDWAVRAQVTSAEMSEIYPYVTCVIPEGAVDADGYELPYWPIGKLNLNTATLPALLCLPGFTETEAQAVIDYRNTNYLSSESMQLDDISWVIDLIEPEILQQAGTYITGKSTVYSTEIVTASKDGRAFKRVQIVVDASTGTPVILYRRDLTSHGWPLDIEIREALRRGEEPGQILSGRSADNPLTFGVR